MQAGTEKCFVQYSVIVCSSNSSYGSFVSTVTSNKPDKPVVNSSNPLQAGDFIKKKIVI